MAAMQLTVEIEEDEDGGYVVQCVEIPGAISQGDTLEEALSNIQDAIIEVLRARREKAQSHAGRHGTTFKNVEVAYA